MDAPVHARANSCRRACDRCGHVSGLSIRRCGCRRPSWRYAEQAQINSASFSLLEPRCFSWSRSVRSFALDVHDLLTCPPLLIPRRPSACSSGCETGIPIVFSLGLHGPDRARHLVCQGYGDQHQRLAVHHAAEPRARPCAAAGRPSYHRHGSDY